MAKPKATKKRGGGNSRVKHAPAYCLYCTKKLPWNRYPAYCNIACREANNT